MGITKHLRGLAILIAGLFVGYIIGPPIAEAAVGLVKIRSCCSTANASVSATHRLSVGTSASTNSVFAITEPSGETVLVSGSGNATKTAPGAGGSDIVGVSLDVPSNTSGQPVTLTLRKTNVQGAGQIIWQGTIQSDGHIDYTFGQSIFICGQTEIGCSGSTNGFNANVTAAAGATVQYEVYGFGFNVACCIRQSLAGTPGS
jgi:hypothetical protein